MGRPTTKEKIISWVFQIIAAIILGMAAYEKFSGNPLISSVFDQLKMGDAGKKLIGIIEAISAIMLLTTNLCHFGALLGLGTMLGALIAHATILGINVNNDGGLMVGLMSLNIICCSIIMFIRRRSYPLIGDTFN
jgi:hypothetical protein